MKVCTRCKLPKESEFFRKRFANRKNGICYYLNSTCKECDGEISSIRYHINKNNPDFKKKNRDRVKKYRIENWDKVRLKLKAKRQTPEYKLYVKKYTNNHKEAIAQLSKKRNVKYVHKIIDSISDSYVLNQLRSEFWKKNRVLRRCCVH